MAASLEAVAEMQTDENESNNRKLEIKQTFINLASPVIEKWNRFSEDTKTKIKFGITAGAILLVVAGSVLISSKIGNGKVGAQGLGEDDTPQVFNFVNQSVPVGDSSNYPFGGIAFPQNQFVGDNRDGSLNREVVFDGGKLLVHENSIIVDYDDPWRNDFVLEPVNESGPAVCVQHNVALWGAIAETKSGAVSAVNAGNNNVGQQIEKVGAIIHGNDPLHGEWLIQAAADEGNDYGTMADFCKNMAE